MFKLFSGLICFLMMKEGFGCIPTKPNDGIYIMIPATDVCVGPAGTSQLFIQDRVEISDGPAAFLRMKAAIGQYQIDFANGAVKYYDGNTPAEYNDAGAIRFWDRTNCPNACTCTAIACYEVRPTLIGAPGGPDLYFYPHCNSPSDCFVAVIIITDGELVNPENSTDIYSGAFQEASPSSNVNQPIYLKIFRVGCSGCPVMK